MSDRYADYDSAREHDLDREIAEYEDGSSGMSDERVDEIRAALDTIRDWLPPMGATSIPEEPIKPAQANELHRAVRTLNALAAEVEQLRERNQEAEAYAKEGWDWLEKALEALGAKDVFHIKASGERNQRLETVAAAARPYRDEAAPHEHLFSGRDLLRFQALDTALAALDAEEHAPDAYSTKRPD